MPPPTKLPHTVAESLRFKPHEPSPLVKARTHEKKAEVLREDDDASPHLEYLERWRALEHAVATVEKSARHEYAGRLGVDDMKAHEVVGHLIASLPRPRLDSIFKDPRIAELNVALGHRDLHRLIEQNELLQDLGIAFRNFVDAKRDLKFQLGLQTYKSALALSLYLTVLRAGCDPKVKKQISLVKDAEILTLGSGILRDVTTHVIEHMQLAHNEFFTVGDRKQVGEAFRIDRAKRSGRTAPDASALPGRPTPVTSSTGKPGAPKPLPKPSPGARKA